MFKHVLKKVVNFLHLANVKKCNCRKKMVSHNHTIIINSCTGSNQEEADTKLILRAINGLNDNRDNQVVIRSSSADTDILIIALILIEDQERVYVGQHTGQNREGLNLGDFNMSLTGNDFVSAYFGKGIKKCYLIIYYYEAMDNLKH